MPRAGQELVPSPSASPTAPWPTCANVHGRQPHTLAFALADSPVGLLAWNSQAVRVRGERDHAAIVSWNTYDRGGHYAAHQAPDLLVDDLRTFFANLIPGRPGTAW
ncbi:hypothetical protein ACU635_31015 [[Actinomadura] parvosata]|uniref:hypothetical protein n=1 Tax=[Actinomadura] parvosata TaxID=1955412 RepID=UPI00406D4CB3